MDKDLTKESLPFIIGVIWREVQRMKHFESFGDCLKRCLKENHLSASEAAKLVGFRSRNSMFRILAGETGDEVKLRFLDKLREVLGDAWPDRDWLALQEALSVERMGPARYQANLAFAKVLMGQEKFPEYMLHQASTDGSTRDVPLGALLEETCWAHRAEIIITSCCESGISRLIAEKCSAAASRGSVTVRQYIDISEECVTQNILGVLPLVSKPWYNARLVEGEACPPEMMAIYRLHCIHVQRWDENGNPSWTICVRYDAGNFTLQDWQDGLCPAVLVIDRWRFQLELLKPMAKLSEGPSVFVAYTEQYAQLEDNCTILSIKPDVHFNCIPTEMLEQTMMEGFAQAGIAVGPDLVALIDALKVVHNTRFDNVMHKHKPTHLVYGLPEMERFMRTGVLSDQFFVQRAYTVEERRWLIRVLLEAMRNQPYFNVHILKEDAPALRYEMSYYDGKGVLLMDAYTGYELDKDHSEALITLPVFMESFRRFVMEELLPLYVRPRAEVLRILEKMLVMEIKE